MRFPFFFFYFSFLTDSPLFPGDETTHTLRSIVLDIESLIRIPFPFGVYYVDGVVITHENPGADWE